MFCNNSLLPSRYLLNIYYFQGLFYVLRSQCEQHKSYIQQTYYYTAGRQIKTIKIIWKKDWHLL